MIHHGGLFHRIRLAERILVQCGGPHHGRLHARAAAVVLPDKSLHAGHGSRGDVVGQQVATAVGFFEWRRVHVVVVVAGTTGGAAGSDPFAETVSDGAD